MTNTLKEIKIIRKIRFIRKIRITITMEKLTEYLLYIHMGPSFANKRMAPIFIPGRRNYEKAMPYMR